MRKTRRTFLRLLGLLVLLAAGLGGLAAGGWLPPFNHWVERRLLAELRVLGVETDATHLRELTWKRAVVGPVKLELPGLTLNAEQARAELGWEVLARRGSPRVVLEGLELGADLQRLPALREALRPSSGGFPYGRLEIERSRVVLRNGGRSLELPFSGFIDSRVEELRAELVVTGTALAGRVSVRGDLVGDAVEVDVRRVEAAPREWSAVLEGVAPEAVAAVRFADAAKLVLSGGAVFAEGRWGKVRLESEFPACAWRADGVAVSVGAGRLMVGAETAEAWRVEGKFDSARWESGDRNAAVLSPVIGGDPDSWRMQFSEGRFAAAGLELAGAGEVSLRRPVGGGAPTGEATLRLVEAGAHGWTLAAPAEVHLRWNGAELTLAAPALELGGAGRLSLVSFEATAGGFVGGHPRLVATAQVGFDLNACLAAEHSDWRVAPGQVAGKVALQAVLDAGAEGVRAEVSIPSQRRTAFSAGTRVEAVLGGEILLDLDREYISGRASLDAREVIARHGDTSLIAPAAVAVIRWPRLWNRAVARWGTLPSARMGRDLLWSGDYEVALREAVVRGGSGWSASGVEFKWGSRGAEIYETGGIDVGLTAAVFESSGVKTSDLRLELVAGLEGGTLRGACAVADLPIRPTIEQTLHWGEGFSAEGTWGFDPVVFAGREPWARWWPQLAGWELSGGVAVSGRSRFADGRWALGADLLLQDFGARTTGGTVAVDGIKGRIVFDSLGPVATATGQRLTCESGVLGGMPFSNLQAVFSYSQAGGLAVSALEGLGFGGRLACGPFVLDPAAPAIATKLGISGAKLEELLRLFDDVPAEASGVVDGLVPLTWKDGKVGFGTGFLRLSPGEIGRVHFTRELHLLTRDRRPGSPEYASLLQVEQSIQHLVFNRLQIDLYPEDAVGQSMRVRLVGAPAGGEFAVPVSIDVNVNAPLEHFLNLGLGGKR